MSESEFDPTEDRQRTVHERQPDDDILVPLTRFQAQKCAVLIDAVAAGQELFQPALVDVSDFLQTLALETGRIPWRTSRSSAQIWAQVNEWPWPPVGAPRSQPE